VPFLTRRRLTIASVALALTAAAGVTCYLLWPAEQSASPPAALVLVEPRPPALLPGGTPVTAEDAEVYRKTQAALVKSEFVVRAALRDPNVSERVRGKDVAWLSERVTAEYGDGGQVLRIGVTGVPPADAAVLANAVADAYLGEARLMEVYAANRRTEQLTAALIKLQKALDVQREALGLKAAVREVPADRADQRALLAALYHERAGLRVELAKARAEGKPADRLQPLQDDLTAAEGRIAACERPGPDAERAEVARLAAAVEAVSAELSRTEMGLHAPPRVRLLGRAAEPPTAVAELGPN
jgi:hypothetical protein